MKVRGVDRLNVRSGGRGFSKPFIGMLLEYNQYAASRQSFLGEPHARGGREAS